MRAGLLAGCPGPDPHDDLGWFSIDRLPRDFNQVELGLMSGYLTQAAAIDANDTVAIDLHL